jgi:hypothetical protein
MNVIGLCMRALGNDSKEFNTLEELEKVKNNQTNVVYFGDSNDSSGLDIFLNLTS